MTFTFDSAHASLTERLARLGVPSETPGSALCYLWANRLPLFQWIPNAFVAGTRMIALRSSSNGDRDEWHLERRNLREDYIAAFGREPPPVTGIALMSDSDQTGSVASADRWHRVSQGVNEA